MAKEKAEATAQKKAGTGGEVNAVNKLSIKQAGADPKDCIRKNAPVFMVRVIGVANELLEKEARSGQPYKQLIGDFQMLNAAGERYTSNKLFLPGTIMENVEAALKAAAGAPVKFAYDIVARPDNDSSLGYVYGAKSLIKTEASDLMAEMEREVGELKVPAELKAPKAA